MVFFAVDADSVPLLGLGLAIVFSRSFGAKLGKARIIALSLAVHWIIILVACLNVEPLKMMLPALTSTAFICILPAWNRDDKKEEN